MSLLLDFIYPRSCCACGHLGAYLCPDCQSQVKLLSFVPSLANSKLDGHLPLFRYTFPLPSLIHDLKYKFVADLVPTLSQMSISSLRSNYPNIINYWHLHHFSLIPIPLNPFRQNWRGFNQSHLIGKNIATVLKLDYIPDLLIRQKYTQVQAHLNNHQQRSQNLDHAFILNPKYLLTFPANVLLFDDVYTTGSTLESAATILRAQGVRTIMALTLAG